MGVTLRSGDCLKLLKLLPDNCVDLVFTSPPYEAARTYDIGFNLKGQDWVDWAVERYVECCRVSRGLVAWVVEGQTRKFRWSATPALLMADLHRAGVKLRKPPAYVRDGIPGSGGPDWLKNRYEFIVCASGGRLPWSDNIAMGHIPKWAPGGEMSNRQSDGARRNKWGKSPKQVAGTSGHRKKDGVRDTMVRVGDDEAVPVKVGDDYKPPALSNPGNVIHCVVGGGNMGSKLAHENEAPFPEKLAEFFVRSFCPPNGTVLDPFLGSGTTAAVAVKNGRNAIGFDVRESQIELTQRRLREECSV